MTNYILHADGDNFFASCLIAKYPHLRNKPLVVGAERGMVTALSPEAKALGITRGMPIFQIKKEFPQAIILAGDYHLFSRVSIRMHTLIGETTTAIEKYSIDESFADITEAIEKRRSTPEIIGREVKARTFAQLGIPISFGVAPTKTLAKLVSTSSKPDGFAVAMTNEALTPILNKIPIEKVWGIGNRTAVKLRARGISTALELRDIPHHLLSDFARPILDIQQELKGVIVHPLCLTSAPLQSMISSQSFPATTDTAFCRSELIRHIEHLARRLRKHKTSAKTFTIYTKNNKQQIRSNTTILSQYSNTPGAFIDILDKTIHLILTKGELIRTTGVGFADIVPEGATNTSLFGENDLRESSIFSAIDDLRGKGMFVKCGPAFSRLK